MIRKIILVSAVAIFTACESGVDKKPVEDNATAMSNVNPNPEQKHVESFESATPGAKYEIGEQVPNNEVCMVNNAYMGRLQLEVPFEGRMYYGCCEMCVERIPQDKDARTAIDPLTAQEVDKATAFIVLTGERGEVAYFKNEENYRAFLNNMEISRE